MAHELDGALLKVTRAHRHLSELKDSIAPHIQSVSRTLTIEDKDQIVTVKKGGVVQVDPAFSTIIGDCLTNLRASLDYIVWELAGKYAGRALIGGKDKTYFPIQETIGGFRKKVKELGLYKIPKAAIAEIKKLQPNNDKYHPLWLLNLLVNEDKHRLLLVVIERMALTVAGRHAWAQGDGVTSLSLARLGTGATPSVKSSPQDAAVYLALASDKMPSEPVEKTLENILKFVENAIPKFSKFF